MMVEIEDLICCLFKLGVLAMLRLKPWSAKGASYHPAFVGNWPTVIHTFLALSTHWMSSPSRQWRRGVSPRFYLVIFVYGVN